MTNSKMSAGADDTTNTDLVLHNVIPGAIEAIVLDGNHHSGA
jgi:hypothetical protein